MERVASVILAVHQEQRAYRSLSIGFSLLYSTLPIELDYKFTMVFFTNKLSRNDACILIKISLNLIFSVYVVETFVAGVGFINQLMVNLAFHFSNLWFVVSQFTI